MSAEIEQRVAQLEELIWIALGRVSSGPSGTFAGFAIQTLDSENTPLQGLANTITFADSSLVDVTLHPVAAGTKPVGTMMAVVDARGNSSTHPITVGSLSGGAIEDPGAPGTFGTSVQISTNSQGVIWIWGPIQAGPTNGWKILATFRLAA